MKLDLAYYGDPILRKKGLPVEKIDDELKQFIKDMEETMFATDGIGLAAPQVKRSIRLFMINVPEKDENDQEIIKKTIVFINPRIFNISADCWLEQEGCLSIPKVYEDVERPVSVSVEAMDEEGNLFTRDFTGWEAKAVLHENDHINGVLFIDRVQGKARKALEPQLNEVKRRYFLKKG